MFLFSTSTNERKEHHEGEGSSFFLYSLLFLACASFLFFTTIPLSRVEASTGKPYKCHELGLGSFPFGNSEYNPFGVPYNVIFPEHKLLMSVRCFEVEENSDMQVSDKYLVRTGANTGKDYVWHTGYISRLTADYKEFLQFIVDHNNHLYIDCNSPDRYVNSASDIPYSWFGYCGGFGGSCSDHGLCFIGQKYEWRAFQFDGARNSGANWIGSVAYLQLDEEPLYPRWDPIFFLSYVCSWTGKWECGCRTKSTCDSTGKWQIQRASLIYSGYYYR